MADANRVAIRTAKAMEAGQAELASAGQKLDVILEKLERLERQITELTREVKKPASASRSTKTGA